MTRVVQASSLGVWPAVLYFYVVTLPTKPHLQSYPMKLVSAVLFYRMRWCAEWCKSSVLRLPLAHLQAAS